MFAVYSSFCRALLYKKLKSHNSLECITGTERSHRSHRVPQIGYLSFSVAMHNWSPASASLSLGWEFENGVGDLHDKGRPHIPQWHIELPFSTAGVAFSAEPSGVTDTARSGDPLFSATVFSLSPYASAQPPAFRHGRASRWKSDVIICHAHGRRADGWDISEAVEIRI